MNKSPVPVITVPGLHCVTCKNPITHLNYIQCYNCNKQFHFSPCTTLIEIEWNSMSAQKKIDWKCQYCNPNPKSPNNAYKSIVFNESQKHGREEDEGSSNDGIKRPKSATTLKTTNNTPNSKTNNIQSDVAEMKTDMKELKTAMQQLAMNMMTLNNTSSGIKDNLANALIKINETLETLTVQVKDLQERDREKTIKIQELDERIGKMEQHAICKNIEIGNVMDTTIKPETVVTKIAASLGAQIDEKDIENSYRITRNNKIIIEFVSITKKRDLLNRLKRHRVDANVLSGDTSIPTNNFIYVNDELTPQNRKILWLAKIRAKECGWKFIWLRNGHIYARKNENTMPILIANTADVNAINQAVEF